MKKPLLFLTLAFLPFVTKAQSAVAIGRLIGSGVVLATRTKSKAAHKADKAAATTTHFKAGSQSIPQKRTPPNQVQGKAKEDIQTLESFLTSCQQAYARPEEKTICLTPDFARTLIQNIHKVQPTWNVQPYKLELAFYEQEQQRRQQPPVAGEVGQ
ncbi:MULTISPECIES: hypothetical protein [Hymenobacter]|uniref:Uncharacterized protein n=1 Tax=Hymenobacter profundi TaxID=1982110 RepID=A0ABS6WX82_9BACT|nr:MULTISPECIES: hypothetical protein [Hymenobacter]MBW3128195.1 hypothetical protein [Hymenobacter profundi]QNE39358.1 hypothetical protein F1C16_07200 [Hymenobacter sp. NBH84]